MERPKINAFIASSNDQLSEDREHFTQILENINANLLPHLQFTPCKWRENLESGSFTGLNVQDIIDTKLLDSCEIVFVIVYSKIGKYTKYEFNRSMRDGKKVFLYFKKGFSPMDANSAEAYAAVFKFKEQAQNRSIIISEYGSKENLEREVQKDLIIFAREHYPLEDESIVRMFNTLYDALPDEDKYALKYFSILPGGSYTLAKIIQWFGLSADEIELTKRSVAVLTTKGILIEKNGVFSVRTGIRKEMEQKVTNLYAAQVLKLMDRFIKEIKLLPEEKDVFQSRLNLNVIDGFVNSEILKSNQASLNLRKSLADYYMAIGTPEYIARAEKILTSFEFDPDNIDLATSLAKVYFEMYKMMKNDKENELYAGEGKYYLSKAKSLLDDFPDSPFHAMSKEMVLKLWVSYEQQDNYKKIKDDIESIITVFNDEYFSDDIRYNIFVLSEYLALGKLTSQGSDYMKKVHNCLIKKAEDATGPESVGYITRKLNYCQYLDKIKEDAILKEILNEISPIIDRFSKEENLEDQESTNKQFLVSEFVNFSVSLGIK